MAASDPLRIHLSLVSHTNVGKTTLARTLLLKDVGEVADRAHVTETTDDYVLARSSTGGELILWDTPGFGNSVALAKRLEGRGNPLGWFLSEVWDRFTDRSFWLDQRSVRHIRDVTSVVLYLVNAAEPPEKAPYIPAEMQILAYIGKPVIVLLNQMGKPRPPEEEAAELAHWKASLAEYPFVTDVLPMDAFARCWVQEAALFDAVGRAVQPEQQSVFEELRLSWTRARRAVYASAVEALARHVWLQASAHEWVENAGFSTKVKSVAKKLGLFSTAADPIADAQTALSVRAADSFCALTKTLIELHGLRGRGVSREIIRRMKSDWSLASYAVDGVRAAAVGGGIGAVSGAAAGAAADVGTGGLTLGLGTLLGGIVGALGGAGAAALYNGVRKKNGVEVSWSESAVKRFVLEAVLLYLAVAHFGRGRGDWREGESPEFWKASVEEALEAQHFSLEELRKEDTDLALPRVANAVDGIVRAVFASLYHRTV